MQRVYSVCSPKPTNDQLALQETIFHNANGYLGVRGTLEEGAPQGMDTMRGAYVNGFYEIVPMKQAEKLLYEEFAHVLHIQRDEVLPYILHRVDGSTPS